MWSDDSLRYALSYFAIFAVAYQCGRLNAPRPWREAPFLSRFLSAAHALTVGASSYRFFIKKLGDAADGAASDDWVTYLVGDLGGNGPHVWHSIYPVTVGYLCHDLLLVLYYPAIRRLETVVHHVVLLGMLAVWAPSEPYLGALGLATELALIPLHAAWLQIKLGHNHLGAGACTLAAFAARVAVYVFLTREAWESSVGRAAAMALLTVMNIYWLLVMLSKAVGKNVSVED